MFGVLFISIVIPCYNEEKHISECLKSVISQNYPKDDLEVICVDGLSTDNTRQVILEFSDQFHNFKLLDNPDRIVSHALNIGIKASVGDVILRLDAHCIYPENYILTLTKKLVELKADNVGAVIKSLPACGSVICKTIAVGSSNSFGVGGSSFRIGTKTIKEVDTVPFGCFRRDIFDRIGYFDTDLIRNQDDEFNARIIKNGGKIYLIPEVSVDYYARENLGKMARMFYQYALFKPLVNKKIGSPATLRQLVPPLFVSALIVGAVLSLLLPITFSLFAGVITLYLLVSLVVSAKEAFKNGTLSLMVILPVVFLIIHLSYGWGYLTGIMKFIVLKTNSVTAEVNH